MTLAPPPPPSPQSCRLPVAAVSHLLFSQHQSVRQSVKCEQDKESLHKKTIMTLLDISLILLDICWISHRLYMQREVAECSGNGEFTLTIYFAFHMSHTISGSCSVETILSFQKCQAPSFDIFCTN